MKRHPAIAFGAWLKARRKQTGVVSRVFAGRIALAPSQYAEVEAGVVQWVQKEQEKLIAENLSLISDDLTTFNDLLARARRAPALSFDEIFTREQLEPVRARSRGKQMTEAGKNAILDAVFRPLG